MAKMSESDCVIKMAELDVQDAQITQQEKHVVLQRLLIAVKRKAVQDLRNQPALAESGQAIAEG